jgi:hypothetical protein
MSNNKSTNSLDHSGQYLAEGETMKATLKLLLLGNKHLRKIRRTTTTTWQL